MGSLIVWKADWEFLLIALCLDCCFCGGQGNLDSQCPCCEIFQSIDGSFQCTDRASNDEISPYFSLKWPNSYFETMITYFWFLNQEYTLPRSVQGVQMHVWTLVSVREHGSMKDWYLYGCCAHVHICGQIMKLLPALIHCHGFSVQAMTVRHLLPCLASWHISGSLIPSCAQDLPPGSQSLP